MFTMTWYKKWFGKEYIDLYTHRNEHEAREFITTLEDTLSLKPGQRILDLCCGSGRYALELARRGFKVTGLDLSEELIHYAEKKSKELDVSVEFLVRDMRDIPYTNHFDGIINMFTSFGYFESDSENEMVVEAAAKSLKPEGWFVLDFMNREYILNNFKTFDEDKKGDILIQQRRSLNKNTNRIEKSITLTSNGTSKEYLESVKLYSPEDLTAMFTKNGFQHLQRFGNYDGDTFTADSPRFILIGRKR